MITRRELFALPLLGRGWFDDDPLETRVAELEEDLEATRRVLGQTIGAVVELARIIDNNTAYFEYRRSRHARPESSFDCCLDAFQ